MPSENGKPMHPWALVFRRLVQAVLPPDAFVDVIPEKAGRVILQGSWLMPQDVAGAALRTQPIRLIVSADAVKAYAAANPAQRLTANQHFQDWLEKRLKSHTTVGQAGSVEHLEKWIIESTILFPAS